MRFLKLKFILTSFFALFFITYNANGTIKPPYTNIVIADSPKTYSSIKFQDIEGKIVDLKNYNGSFVILNFWATWCLPCKKEMPSLDNLQINKKIDNLKIFPINLEKKNIKKTEKFFSNINIKNLSIYFDPEFKLTKILSLRGVPTTILFDRQGKEFARIIGSINFEDKKFIDWLSQYS